MYVCMYVCMYECIYILCMYACMYVWMYVCMYECIYYACMHACMYVCMHVCTWTQVEVRVQVVIVCLLHNCPHTVTTHEHVMHVTPTCMYMTWWHAAMQLCMCTSHTARTQALWYLQGTLNGTELAGKATSTTRQTLGAAWRFVEVIQWDYPLVAVHFNEIIM